MAFWIRTGDVDVGVSDGVIRRADFAGIAQACELNARAAERLSEAGEEAAQILAEASRQAREEIAHAQGESARIRAEAQQQGLRDAAERWAQEIAQKAFSAHETMQRGSDRLAELVSLATQRVIEGEDKDGLYRRALRTVRHLASESKSLTLHIGTADAEHARSIIKDLANEIGIAVPLEIKVDSRLMPGGCVLESDYGVIDASLGLQVQAVKLAISKAARAALGRVDTGPATVPAHASANASEGNGHGS